MTKLKNLLLRALSGAVFVAVVVGSLLCCERAFAAVMLLCMVVSMHEFFGISRALGVKPQYGLGMTIAVVMFAAGYIIAFEKVDFFNEQNLIFAPIPLCMLVFFVELFRKNAQPFTNIAYTLLSLMYVAFPFALMSAVYSANAEIMLCFFILLWANDTFAYLFGITLGRHKLFPSISPKKSWEGYVGGIISVVVCSCFLHRAFNDIAMVHMVAVGVIISVTAVLADLVESMLKRSAGVKDSGKIMPGHGGLLDRFDAALLSLPLVFVYVMVFM
ncbi:MAG: phosphatidate cytidylyltransferase [Prevotellaceae bacterium]|jgi:phosphatidate cytidylyltransferase|nr:phosphatidate cytidylyltransferase [Prevotellaceae bacterium]